MKKLFLLFFIPFASFAQTTDFKPEAEKILNHIRNREFSAALANLDTSVNNKVDTARLRKLWDNIERLAGPFVKVNETSTEHQPTFDIVLQHLQFEKKKIDFKLVFGDNGKVKGLTFLPGEQHE